MPTPSESRVTVSGKPSKAVELLRKRLRLSLGAMMIVVLGIGCVLGWVAHRAHVQRDAVAAITTLRRNTRGSVYYDWQYVAGQGAKPPGPKWMSEALGKFDEHAKPRGPKWLRDALGPDVFDTVVNVNIEGDNVDDELLENVGKLHGVEFLSIQGHAAPDLTPGGMAQLRTLSRLKVLSVRGFTDSHGFVAGLTGKTGLRRLSLPEETPSRTMRWRSSAAWPTWKSCKLKGRNVTDRGFAHVANLKKLTILDMPGGRITDLASVAAFAQLDVLSLFLAPTKAASARSVPSSGGPSSLGPLRRLTKLTQLTLRSTRIEDRELAVVAGLPKLNNLIIGGRGITEAGLARIAESKSLASLGFTDTSIADLRPLSPRLHAISTLWMENSHLTDAGIEPLSRVIRLTDLTIAGSRMTGCGARSHPRLPDFPLEVTARSVRDHRCGACPPEIPQVTGDLVVDRDRADGFLGRDAGGIPVPQEPQPRPVGDQPGGYRATEGGPPESSDLVGQEARVID